MKEYIQKLAQGNFVYERPTLEISQTTIVQSVPQKKDVEYSFAVNSNAQIKGLVYSSNEHVTLKSTTFEGNEIKIDYCVHAGHFQPDDHICGQFQIVSSAGEAQIGYDFCVTQSPIPTEEVSVSSVYELCQLAQISLEQATVVFLSEDFAKVVKKESIKLQNLYEMLMSTQYPEESMEEFFVAAKQKKPVEINFSESSLTYDLLDQDTKGAVTIQKSSWGFCEYELSSDGDAIELSMTHISSNDFKDNSYELKFSIHHEKLHAGHNYARIFLIGRNDRKVVEININQKRNQMLETNHKKVFVNLTRAYLDFRFKKIDSATWIDHSEQGVNLAKKQQPDDIDLLLIQAQIHAVKQNWDQGTQRLNQIGEIVCDSVDKKQPSVTEVERYCYYLYVNSLYVRKSDYTAQAAKIVTEIYENGYHTWKILWLLLYLDGTHEKNQSLRLVRLKDICRMGCNSPVMYLEALTILNAQPELLRVLNDFEIQVILFGCKHQMINANLALQISEKIRNEKVFSRSLLHVLQELYTLLGTDEILTVLVTYFIRNELIGEAYFQYYENGILRGLRITRLYEFYIFSMDHKQLRRLPKMVLMYFSYGSNLPFEEKAFLYANIIVNEAQNQEVLSLYHNQMLEFGLEQMRLGHINQHLVTVYQYLLQVGTGIIPDDLSEFMVQYAFTYKVICFVPSMKEVIVKHKELKESVSYPIVDGVAFIQMYTQQCTLVFCDSSKVRKVGAVRYEIQKIVHLSEQDQMVYCQKNQKNLLSAIYLYERGQSEQIGRFHQALIRQSLFVRKEELDDLFCKQLVSDMIFDYHDELGMAQDVYDFRLFYPQVENTGLSYSNASILAEICIEHEMYQEALEFVHEYGYQSVAPISVLKLATSMLQKDSRANNLLLVRLCHFAFIHGCMNAETLCYLEQFFQGTNAQMCDIWKMCKGNDIETKQLSERLIVQMLFTADESEDAISVFMSYYKEKGYPLVVNSFLSYYSFLYVVRQQAIDPIAFKVMEERAGEKNEIPQICRVALLKYDAENLKQGLSEVQLKTAQKQLDYLCAHNIIFEFYKQFANVLILPFNMKHETVLEYRANPDRKVQIHYTLQQNPVQESYIVQTLQCSISGVFTKKVLMFYGDTIHYYFTEDDGKQVTQSEHFSFVYTEDNLEHDNDRFHVINEIMKNKDTHDYDTMNRQIQQYIIDQYVNQHLFQPMKTE